MTAVINGESISHEITQKQYDKFMAIDDYHRMKLFSHIFKEVDMKTIPGEGKNIGAQIGGALLAGLAVMSELGRDRPAPAVFVEHHHDHAHGPTCLFQGQRRFTARPCFTSLRCRTQCRRTWCRLRSWQINNNSHSKDDRRTDICRLQKPS